MPASTYQVTIGERLVRVQLRRQGEGCLVRVDDGPEQPVELGTVHGALYSLLLGDQRTELLASRAANHVALAIAGLEYHADVVDEVRARLESVTAGRSGSQARRELKAPMSGLLAKVLCQAGDTIEPRQPLVVLEAMKMENELSLPLGGTVISLYAEAGQIVEQGQVLLEVE